MSNKTAKDLKWSSAIRRRDQYCCRWCGRADTDLQAAHIVPRRYLNVRWDLDNGLLLCSSNGCRTHDMYDGKCRGKQDAMVRIQKIVGIERYDELWKSKNCS